MKNILRLKKGDAAIIAAVLLTALFLFLLSSSDGSAVAEISVDGKTVKTIDLSEKSEAYSISLENGVIIEVSDNCIYFLESDCRGRDCIACGRLSSPGETAVCIPNRTVIKLTGKSDGAFDAVSY